MWRGRRRRLRRRMGGSLGGGVVGRCAVRCLRIHLRGCGLERRKDPVLFLLLVQSLGEIAVVCIHAVLPSMGEFVLLRGPMMPTPLSFRPFSVRYE